MKKYFRRYRLVLSTLAVLLGASPAWATGQDGLTGNWVRGDGDVRIKIAHCGENFCATNTWVKDPNGKEHVGDQLILSLKQISSSVIKGHAYDVRRKMNYGITITLQPEAISTSGCVLFGIICKRADWTREN